MTAIDLATLRATEWPWTTSGDVIYLNHASTGPVPVRTLAAQQEFGARRATPWRISYDDQFGTLHRVRSLCASLVGAAPLAWFRRATASFLVWAVATDAASRPMATRLASFMAPV